MDFKLSPRMLNFYCFSNNHGNPWNPWPSTGDNWNPWPSSKLGFVWKPTVVYPWFMGGRGFFHIIPNHPFWLPFFVGSKKSLVPNRLFAPWVLWGMKFLRPSQYGIGQLNTLSIFFMTEQEVELNKANGNWKGSKRSKLVRSFWKGSLVHSKTWFSRKASFLKVETWIDCWNFCFTQWCLRYLF